MAEVCSVVDVSQFAVGHSVDKCGPYAVSLAKYAGRPGQAPTGSASDVASWADSEYIERVGPDVSSDDFGVTVATLFQIIQDADLHYQCIGAQEIGFQQDHLTADYIRAWVHAGYPVVLSVAEDAVYDCDLGSKPYSWDTSGLYHVILCTGVTDDGNLLCHDTASIGPNGVRSGPRRYDASRLQQGLTSATVVVLPWLQRPDPNFDPTIKTVMIETGEEVMPGVPQGWTDDGTYLRDSNNQPPEGLTGAVRTNILSGWNPSNTFIKSERVPFVIDQDHRWREGTRVYFRYMVIACADAPDPVLTGGQQQTNVTFRVPCGIELLFDAGIISNQDAQIATLKQQFAALQPGAQTAQIQALEAKIAQAIKTLQ